MSSVDQAHDPLEFSRRVGREFYENHMRAELEGRLAYSTTPDLLHAYNGFAYHMAVTAPHLFEALDEALKDDPSSDRRAAVDAAWQEAGDTLRKTIHARMAESEIRPWLDMELQGIEMKVERTEDGDRLVVTPLDTDVAYGRDTIAKSLPRYGFTVEHETRKLEWLRFDSPPPARAVMSVELDDSGYPKGLGKVFLRVGSEMHAELVHFDEDRHVIDNRPPEYVPGM
jgi:hypothetical protein